MFHIKVKIKIQQINNYFYYFIYDQELINKKIGLIVDFTLNLEDIIKKINIIEECKMNKTKKTESTRILFINYHLHFFL